MERQDRQLLKKAHELVSVLVSSAHFFLVVNKTLTRSPWTTPMDYPWTTPKMDWLRR